MKFTWRIVLRTLLLVWAGTCLEAAVIPKLYNSGVDDTGAILANSAVDPHYKITASADESAPGPDAFTLLPGFPVGPWIAEGPDSRWIGPSDNQGTGNAEGDYTYETTFDLTGFDAATANITGRWSVDNSGVDILLNGASLGLVNTAGFGGWTDFTIDSGFIAGVNTLEFVVNNAPATPNPTGFRVEMTGRVTSPTESPSILTPPQTQTVVAGDTVHLSVEAAGASPLTYQWNFKGNAISGATSQSYTITGVKTNDTGDYTVTIKNGFGQITSAAATITVLVPYPGIYNTGVNDSRAVLDDGTEDPHYKLILNPNDSTSSSAVVHDSTVFPIVSGPWLPNTDKSKWIAPLLDTTAAAPGDYTYELDLDLTGYDPATAFIAGDWAVDNTGSIFLNGADTSFKSTGFGAFSPFNITSGFISGINKLEFRVNNAGPAAGYTGLRVENLRGTAEKSTIGQTAPKIVTQAKGGTKVMTDKITFTVVADGTAPLTFQWSHNGAEIPGATSPSYALAQILPNDAGTYTVKVSNALGSVTSDTIQLDVIQPDTGVFNTGVDSTNTPLPVGQFDTHYVLLANPDSAHPGIMPFAIANHPAWVANDEDSQWISPSAARDDVAPGNYQYRLIFEIPAKDVATAAITGSFATDDGSGGIFLNGTQVDNAGGGFGGLATLDIPAGSGFVAGLNTLDFFVNNGGSAANPSGLRVDDMILTGVTYDPEINLQPQDITLVEGADLSLAVGVLPHTTPITYQWQFNGKDISGATSATFSMPNISVSSNGNYTAIITSPAGTATSRTAVVKVLAVPGAARQGGSGADGLVVVEAEDYNQKVGGTPAGATAEINWTKITDPAGFSGTGAMQALPNNGINVNITTAGSPRLDYKIKFEKAGEYIVWVRGLGDSGTGNPSIDDSVNVGLDMTLPSTSDRISVFTLGAGYIWSNGLGDGSLDGNAATFVVGSPGLHVINVWMREDGFIFDKLLLTLDDSFVPTGVGPAESPLIGGGEQAHLTIAQSSGTITISWDKPGTLESADKVDGPYNPVAGVTGQSFQTSANAASQKFYRIKH